TLLFSYLWSAYNEAIARKDITWVRRTFRLTLYAGASFTFVAVLALAFVVRPFIGWWAAPSIEPSYTLIVWIATWSVINSFTNPIACLLAAASHLRAQTIYSTIATIVNIFLSIHLSKLWGLDGVIAGTVISYAVFLCIPAFVDVTALLKRLQNAL
ncbi:MAG TPA: polysaccharide biosynthesis C-terminal domain-containing protein, partial [Halothiobacillus sp.]|nr:polysaccharide biosynthesis C-terminal domain-containing protein [Halothiobacillus sp.]